MRCAPGAAGQSVLCDVPACVFQIFSRIALNSSLRMDFSAVLFAETSLMNRSAGVIPSASEIRRIISNEGFALPDSIPPMVPVPQSHSMASCVCEIPRLSR